MKPPFATGLGYDVHAFAAGRRLILGGVEIPSEVGLLGHSDADVLLHAICDALLGAAGLPDIGHYFPNTDARWKDVSSRELLREVLKYITAAGWRVGNIDATLIAEKPRIAPHVDAMKRNIAKDLAIDVTQVAIKATTNERMGFVGREEGIAAMATCLLMRE
ncbi:2-C-methyl-D-erythritol 2,4-cyclodiphosphate synthase [soil metagenome]